MAKYKLIWDEKTKKPKMEKEISQPCVKDKDDAAAQGKHHPECDPVVVEKDGTVIIKGAEGDVVIPTDIWNHGSGPHVLVVEY